MITFKRLRWGNFFSYGPDNVINFTESPVTQLVGLNGSGKTSIALILQEITYSKNIKKIVKAKLKNRYSKENLYADLLFDKNDTEYSIVMKRTATKLTVNLFKDGEDISSHTAAATMKTIEGILNIDFDTFSQLVYQSTKNSLLFLTATDTQRKKFLITLFNLEKYIEIFDELKDALATINKEINVIQGKYSVYADWIKEHESLDLSSTDILEVPELNEEDIGRLTQLQLRVENAQEINKKINTNNEYREELKGIDTNLLTSSLVKPVGIKELEKSRGETSVLKAEEKKILKSVDGLKPFCQVCGQSIDIEDSIKLAEKCRTKIKDFEKKFDDTSAQLKILYSERDNYNSIEKAVQEFEKLSNLVDYDLNSEVVNVAELSTEISLLKKKITTLKDSINKTNFKNIQIAKDNSTAEIKKKQLVEYGEKLNIELVKLTELSDTANQIEILKEAFSTKGLVSYKLEYLVKDLEIVINSYLEDLSRGRFQINFILQNDKLNIEVVDNGNVITINEVSEGELSKINVSALLAIRKLMQQLSNTKLNLLFLDEIMGVLDTFGREDLIKVLLREESLNTFLVTHEYTHPLVPVLNIVQEDNISRIENG